MLKTLYFGGTLNQLMYFFECAKVQGKWNFDNVNFYQFDFTNGGIFQWWPQDGSAAFLDCTEEDKQAVGNVVTTLR